MTQVTLDINLEQFRYSLIGDGYLKEEVIKMSEEELVLILKRRVYNHIYTEFEKSRRFGYLED